MSAQDMSTREDWTWYADCPHCIGQMIDTTIENLEFVLGDDFAIRAFNCRCGLCKSTFQTWVYWYWPTNFVSATNTLISRGWLFWDEAPRRPLWNSQN